MSRKKHAAGRLIRLLPALVLIMITGAACTPWYKAYNIETRDGLTRLSSVPELIRALQEGEPAVRVKAADALKKIGPPARDAVPALKVALNDESYRVRQAAADALEGIVLNIVVEGTALSKEDFLLTDEEKNIAVMILTTRLGSKDWITQRDSAYELAKMGETAAPAVPALITALKNYSNWHVLYNEVRRAAAFALGNIGLEASAANPALIEALSNIDHDVRLEATIALGKIGPQTAEGVVEALIGLLGDSDSDVRREATVALGNFETYAVSALPALVTTVLTDMDMNVRREAVKAIGRIEPSTDSALNALVIALIDKNPDVRNDALIALRKADPEEMRYILPDIILRLNDVEESVRFNAVKTLVGCGIGGDLVCDALERLALEDKSTQVKREAVEALIILRKIESD